MSERPLVGVSSCLTGMAVRYDGHHKYQSVLMAAIAPQVRLLPLCPESMAGMGIPRGPVNLVEDQNRIRALGRDDPERDVTERLLTMGRIVARTYPGLCGYILQSRSPSCGFGSTPVYDSTQSRVLTSAGNGLFVSALLEALPGLPILDDRQLDAESIAGFLAQVRERAMSFKN